MGGNHEFHVRSKDLVGGTLTSSQRTELDELSARLAQDSHNLTSQDRDKIKKWVAEREQRSHCSAKADSQFYSGIHPEEQQCFDQFTEAMKKVQKDYQLRLNSSQAYTAEQQGRKYKEYVNERKVEKDFERNPKVRDLVVPSS